jgi:hypothetical protein
MTTGVTTPSPTIHSDTAWSNRTSPSGATLRRMIRQIWLPNPTPQAGACVRGAMDREPEFSAYVMTPIQPFLVCDYLD